MSQTSSNSTSVDLFQQVALLVLTPNCFDTYFKDLNFMDGPCFSATLSKCLGFALILGSILVKLPQILKILQSKNGYGISMLSVTLDLTAMTIYMAYSYLKEFPFSSWGDASFLAIQTVIIAFLVLYYSGAHALAAAYVLAYAVILVIMMGGFTPIGVLWSLQGCNIFIAVSGKLAQAYINYQNGHTGQLSAVTLVMLFFGSLARIFTSIQETGDTVVILTYIASTVANTVLVGQLIYYWNVVMKKVHIKDD